MLAVTATATPDVRKDIEAWLGLRDPVVVVQGFDRPNLHFEVRRTVNDVQKREALRNVQVVSGADGIVTGERQRDLARLVDDPHASPA